MSVVGTTNATFRGGFIACVVVVTLGSGHEAIGSESRAGTTFVRTVGPAIRSSAVVPSGKKEVKCTVVGTFV